MKSDAWNRVSKSVVCPICKKPDWCLVSVDGALAICSRVESQYRARSSVGWIHRLREDNQPWDKWRKVRTRNPVVATTHVGLSKLAERLHRAMTDAGYQWLSSRLGVSVESLRRLRVGWHSSRQSYSFPMREANGHICGIRYRAIDDSKFSERGGREGMFFSPADLVRDYLIVVEGGSDAAAILTIGYPSVVGRSNCVGSVQHIVSLCRRLNPHRMIIIPDNDSPGIRGAESLALVLPSVPTILKLPDGIKDVRACIASTKNADWLRDQIGTLIQTSTNGVTSHDRSI